MKEKFKKLLSAVSALAVTIAVLPITELPAIAEDEMADVMNEPADFSFVEDDSATEEVINDSDIVVSTFDTPMIMAAQTGITKEEWIHDLVTVLDMSIEDESTIEYYFTDVDSSTYAYDINLAANYGVFDVKSDTFNPSDYVTREFAAHTANFCIGYLDDGTTVTFSDSDAIYYEYDAIVSVQRGWFSIQNGKFVPDGYMTDAECEKILDDARACLENTAINTNNENTVKYANSVVQFEETSNAAYFDGVVTIANTQTTLRKGDVFLVNVDGTDCLYTANAVKKDANGNLLVDVETAKTNSAVEYIDIEGYGEVDYDNIIFYDTGSKTADVAKISSENGTLYFPKSTAILASASHDSITLNKKLEDDGITISLSGAITNIQPEYKLKLNPLSGGVESFYLNASADASITASMKGEFKNTKSRDIKIASVPVICAGIFNVNMIVSVTVSVSGETTLSYSWEMDGGISYTKADGWRTTKNFQKKGFSLEAEVSESVAVKAALVATLGKEKMGEAYLMGGEKGTISGKQQKDGVGCVTLNAYVFAEYGASFNLLGIKTFSDSTQFINAQNSPVKINLHWEDGKLVDKCSYGDDITGSSLKPSKSLTYVGGYSLYGTEYEGLISSTDDYTPYQTWTESKKITGNVTVDGDLYLKNDVNLNGYTLTVNGDLIQTKGEMYINGGTLNVNGSYTVSDTGTLDMYVSDSIVNVRKDFTIENNVKSWSSGYYNGSTHERLYNGILSIGGNFYQYNGKTVTDNFKSTNNHIVKFVGSGIHEIYLESPYSYIGELSVSDGAKVKFTGYFTGFRANQDLTVAGDLTLYGGSTLDLNGNTLTVEGDFTQNGTIDLNCGTINVNGIYESDGYIKNTGYQESIINVNKEMQLSGGGFNLNEITMTVNGDLVQTNGEMYINGGTLNVNGSYTVSDTGTLDMYVSDSIVNVGKDFTVKNNVKSWSSGYYNGNTHERFYNGILSIGGNFYQYNGKTVTDNFKSTNNHIVKFVGSGVHKISSESSDISMHDIILTDGASISFNGSFGGFSTVSSCTFSSSKPTVAKITDNTVQSVSVGYATLKIDDKVSIDLTVEEVVTGDANGDGKLTVADAVLLQKWLLAVPHVRLANWEACDLCKDGRIDVFDLCLLKRKLINS